MRAALLPFLAIAVLPVGIAVSQSAVVVRQPENGTVSTGQNGATKIPKGYQAYSLFVIPSEDWQTDTAETRKLRAAFQSFGEAIGNKKAAIWFANKDDTKLDVIASKQYCDLFDLDYNNGPYIVTTNKYPPDLHSNDDVIVIKLGGISMARATTVLNVLEQDLRKDRAIRNHTLIFTELEQRLLTINDRHGSELKEIATTILKLK